MSDNMVKLLIVYSAAIVSFVLLFSLAVKCTLAHHRRRKIMYSSEVTLIKYNLKILRLAVMVLIGLQYPLFSDAMEKPESVSAFDSIVRPLATICVLAVGFNVNGHPAFRWIFGFGMVFLVIFDTASQVVLDADVECLRRGAACSGRFDNRESIAYFIKRDFMAIGFELVCLLQTAYLGVAIGMCSSRYSEKVLSTSVPDTSIREILKAHHPHL